MCVHNQSSSQTGLYFSFSSYERKNVNLPLVGNTSKFYLGNIMELCFLASVDQQRRKCSILSYKEHSPLYFFYYKSVLYCLGLFSSVTEEKDALNSCCFNQDSMAIFQ